MDQIAREWDLLCRQHDEARNEYNEAQAPVIAGFRAVYNGNQASNPTPVQLERAKSAWQKWEEIKARMDRFAREHA